MSSSRLASTAAHGNPLAAMPLLTAAGFTVAPHVAARLAWLTADEPESLPQVAAMLGRECLAGVALPPDPLPSVTAMRSGIAVGALDDTARRVLLVAAVAVLDRADVLLAASGADVAALLTGPASQHLELDGGRFRFVDPRVRMLVHEDAPLAARTEAHTALSAALKAAGEPAVALWHTALGTLAGDPLLANGLVELAEQQLGRGDAVQAHQIAREAANQGTGEVRAHAFLAAGMAALWGGHQFDAVEWLRRAVSTGVDAVQARAELALGAIEVLRHGGRDPGAEAGATGPGATGPGATGHGATGHGATGPGATGPGDAAAGLSPGVQLAQLVEPVRRVTRSAADQAAMSAVVETLSLLDTEPDEADAVLARAALAAVPARQPDLWAESEGALTPLAEAHLRVAESLVLFRAGDSVLAGEVLVEAAGRLPVGQVAGGLAAALLRQLERERLGSTGLLAAALEAVGGETPLGAAVASCQRGAPGPGDSSEYSLVARTLHAGRADAIDARSPSAVDAPGGALWAALLTAREVDVVSLVAAGLGNRQIANRLCVSVRTVEVHLGRVFRKLGVHSRTELVRLALQSH